MAICSTTQYSITCDCGEGDVLNQGDFETIWTLRDAMSYWRRNNWRIGKFTHSCPNCSRKKHDVKQKQNDGEEGL